jgi:hypothetical protein
MVRYAPSLSLPDLLQCQGSTRSPLACPSSGTSIPMSPKSLIEQMRTPQCSHLSFLPPPPPPRPSLLLLLRMLPLALAQITRTAPPRPPNNSFEVSVAPFPPPPLLPPVLPPRHPLSQDLRLRSLTTRQSLLSRCSQLRPPVAHIPTQRRVPLTAVTSLVVVAVGAIC